jgi:Ca2+/Na+ antiporter
MDKSPFDELQVCQLFALLLAIILFYFSIPFPFSLLLLCLIIFFLSGFAIFAVSLSEKSQMVISMVNDRIHARKVEFA